MGKEREKWSKKSVKWKLERQLEIGVGARAMKMNEEDRGLVLREAMRIGVVNIRMMTIVAENGFRLELCMVYYNGGFTSHLGLTCV